MQINVGHGLRQTARSHVAVHPERAVGGVLLGDSTGETVHVTSLIPAFTAPAPQEPIAITAAAWTAVRGQLQRHPGERIIGWYVSRRADEPRLSAEVARLHREYFAAPGTPTVLLVLDDPAGESWFCSHDGTLKRVDRNHIAPPAPVPRPRLAPAAALWWQRAACALAGTCAGVAIWAAAIHTDARAAPPSTAAGAAPHAHPIVVEPQAGGGTP